MYNLNTEKNETSSVQILRDDEIRLRIDDNEGMYIWHIQEITGFHINEGLFTVDVIDKVNLHSQEEVYMISKKKKKLFFVVHWRKVLIYP